MSLVAKTNNYYLIDEIHTPDSSRYFYLAGFQDRQELGERQRQLSKEFVREWLIAKGFHGLDGETVPDFPGNFIQEVSERYIELFEKITGQAFPRSDENEDPLIRIESNVRAALEELHVNATRKR